MYVVDKGIWCLHVCPYVKMEQSKRKAARISCLHHLFLLDFHIYNSFWEVASAKGLEVEVGPGKGVE